MNDAFPGAWFGAVPMFWGASISKYTAALNPSGPT